MAKYKIMVDLIFGNGIDEETYIEEYSGIEYCTIEDAKEELKEARSKIPNLASSWIIKIDEDGDITVL